MLDFSLLAFDRTAAPRAQKRVVARRMEKGAFLPWEVKKVFISSPVAKPAPTIEVTYTAAA